MASLSRICREFLSSNAQDFIEDLSTTVCNDVTLLFLSSNAQDFIEEWSTATWTRRSVAIPEQ